MVVRALEVADKLKFHLPLSQRDFLASKPFSDATNGYDLQQFLAFDGKRTETVDEVLAIGFQGTVVLDGVEFAIENHALLRAWHVVVGEVHREVALESAVGDIPTPVPSPREGSFIGVF